MELSVQLYSGMLEKKVYTSETIADSWIINRTVLKCFLKVTLKSKGRLVPVISVQYSSFSFLSMAFAMSVHCSQDLTCSFNSDILTVGCCRANSTFSTAWEPKVMCSKERDTANKIFKISGLGNSSSGC